MRMLSLRCVVLLWIALVCCACSSKWERGDGASFKDSSVPGDSAPGDRSVSGDSAPGDRSISGDSASGDRSVPGDSASDDLGVPGDTVSDDSTVPGDSAPGDRSASGDSSVPAGGQGSPLPVPKPVNAQARASSRNVPVLSKAQQARMNEVDQYIARVVYHGGRIVASYRLPSGDIVDFIDRSTLPPLPYPLPALPFKPQDMVLPPGVELGRTEEEQFPELVAMAARATPFTRPAFWPYILGETDAVSIEDYLHRYTLGGGPR